MMVLAIESRSHGREGKGRKGKERKGKERKGKEKRIALKPRHRT